jgi:hypothetical protein
MKPIQFRGKETMSYNKTEQPTAEGAEEILQKYMDMSMIICPLHVVPRTVALDAMHEFATLHAQRIADKMVEERLKNAPKNCPKAAQCAHVEGGMKCPPNVICPI